MKGYLPLLANNQSFARMGMWQSYDLDDQAKYNQHELERTLAQSLQIRMLRKIKWQSRTGIFSQLLQTLCLPFLDFLHFLVGQVDNRR